MWRFAPPIRLATADPPSSQEDYCAWFGDERDGVLYFGESPFWWALRAGEGDARADLGRSGPQRIGRFDLRKQALRSPLEVSSNAPCGTWDVLAHANDRVYFTTFFETAGYVDPVSGRVHRFGPETVGLNEIAAGPQGSILVSRYAAPGSVVVLDAEGGILEEFPLEAPADHRVAAKTVAFDPVRREYWVNTDLIPEAGGPIRHDARVLDRWGRQLRRWETPEIQFVIFASDGVGYVAERADTRLALRILAPDRHDRPRAGTVVPLDDRFPPGLDFVQDLHLGSEGSIVVTRWSGRIHRVSPDGEVRDYVLPRPDPQALYYTAVIHGDQLCATLCAGVTVVCLDLDPEAGTRGPGTALDETSPQLRQRR